MLVKYMGLQIMPSYSAMRELMQEGKTLLDVLEILEQGYYAPRKRKQGTIEKDKRQNEVLASNGYKVFRFTELEINDSVEVCVGGVIDYINSNNI